MLKNLNSLELKAQGSVEAAKTTRETTGEALAFLSAFVHGRKVNTLHHSPPAKSES